MACRKAETAWKQANADEMSRGPLGLLFYTIYMRLEGFNRRILATIDEIWQIYPLVLHKKRYPGNWAGTQISPMVIFGPLLSQELANKKWRGESVAKLNCHFLKTV